MLICVSVTTKTMDCVSTESWCGYVKHNGELFELSTLKLPEEYRTLTIAGLNALWHHHASWPKACFTTMWKIENHVRVKHSGRLLTIIHGRQNGRLFHWPKCSCMSTKTKLWKLLLRRAVCLPSLIVQCLPEWFWNCSMSHFRIEKRTGTKCVKLI